MVGTVGHAVELIFTLKTEKRILCAAGQYIPTNPQYTTYSKRSSNASYSVSVDLETWNLWRPSWIEEN